jgi:hypothetical protein
MTPKPRFRTFLICEALALALLAGAYLLPREPRPIIPTVLVAIGFMLAFVGIGFLPWPRGGASVDSTTMGLSGLGGGDGGHSHGDCGGGHGGGDGGCGH